MGKLLSIAVKERPHGPMTSLVEARIDRENGIAGDPRGRGGSSGRRQVTVVVLEKWQAACQDLGTDSLSLSWTARRANLLVDGIEFSQDSIGKTLHIGPEVCLEITGETTPCSRMDEAHMGLQEALTPDWRGGVTCKVKCGGIIRVGMRVWI